MPNGSDKASSQKGKGVWFSILRELKPHKFGLTIALVLGIVVSGLSLLQPLLIGSIVNSVSSEVLQVFFRLSGWENLDYAEGI